MTDLNKQELRRLAEASAENESWYELADFHAGRVTALELDVVSEADRNFIVSASPDALLALLDALDSLERNKEETLQLIGMNIGESVAAFQKIKAEARLAQMRLHDVAELCATVEQERDQLRAEVEALRKESAAIRRQFEYWKQRAKSAEGHIYSPKSDLRCAAKALQPRTRLRDRAWHELNELEQYELMLAAHDVIRAVDQSRHARRPKDMSVISESSCGVPVCCQFCADEAGEVGNGQG